MAEQPTRRRQAAKRQPRQATANGSRFASRLTAAVERKILDALAKGNYLETAAAAAGVSATTVREWLQRGNQGDPRYEAFAVKAAQARAKGELELVDDARRGAAQDGRVALEMLGRMFPDRWGRITRLEHGNADGQPFALTGISASDLEGKPLELLMELRQLLARLEAETIDAAPADVRELEAGDP